MMLALAVVLVTYQNQPADLVLENARIWSSGRSTLARAAAVRNGRFIHVGDDVSLLVGPKTRRVDAQGAVVIPGLIDSHAHMISGGIGLNEVHLREAKDRADFVRRVETYAKSLPSKAWITGGRWSVESWKDQTLPHKNWIDSVSGGRPALLERMDGHSALANSEALRIAGITKDGPPDPPGGVIDRDPTTKEPTGILRESATSLVDRHIPAPSRDQQLSALKAAIREANKNGVTAVSDVTSVGALKAYEQLATDPQMTGRLYLYVTVGDLQRSLPAIKAFKGKPGWIELKGIKQYMDGSLGSRTAYMHEPFTTNDAGKGPDWRGLPTAEFSEGFVERNASLAMKNGLQTITHAIGDQANHELLNLLARVYPNLKDARCRSEHAQHILPADIPRFATLGVIPSMQPYHKADDGRYAERFIGPDRSRTSYAFASFLRAGSPLAFGSDWPVVTINPFVGIEAAVSGKIMDGSIWQPQENITVEQALTCYTANGAHAVFAERQIGRIAPGYRADFVILNSSPFKVSPEWAKMAPKAVYVEGRKAL